MEHIERFVCIPKAPLSNIQCYSYLPTFKTILYIQRSHCSNIPHFFPFHFILLLHWKMFVLKFFNDNFFSRNTFPFTVILRATRTEQQFCLHLYRCYFPLLTVLFIHLCMHLIQIIDFSSNFLSLLKKIEKQELSNCVGCGNQIHDQYILRVAPDLEWHAACLKCHECRQFLDERCTCFVKDGRTYCKRDYVRLVHQQIVN